MLKKRRVAEPPSRTDLGRELRGLLEPRRTANVLKKGMFTQADLDELALDHQDGTARRIIAILNELRCRAFATGEHGNDPYTPITHFELGGNLDNILSVTCAEYIVLIACLVKWRDARHRRFCAAQVQGRNVKGVVPALVAFVLWKQAGSDPADFLSGETEEIREGAQCLRDQSESVQAIAVKVYESLVRLQAVVGAEYSIGGLFGLMYKSFTGKHGDKDMELFPGALRLLLRFLREEGSVLENVWQGTIFYYGPFVLGTTNKSTAMPALLLGAAPLLPPGIFDPWGEESDDEAARPSAIKHRGLMLVRGADPAETAQRQAAVNAGGGLGVFVATVTPVTTNGQALDIRVAQGANVIGQPAGGAGASAAAAAPPPPPPGGAAASAAASVPHEPLEEPDHDDDDDDDDDDWDGDDDDEDRCWAI